MIYYFLVRLYTNEWELQTEKQNFVCFVQTNNVLDIKKLCFLY